jgi:hypothetical protein
VTWKEPVKTKSLDNAVVYDIETIANAFTMNVQGLHSDLDMTFEISQFRNDEPLLQQWFEHWSKNNVPMIGYNSVAFDYPVLHFIRNNPGCTVWDIYEHAQWVIDQGRAGRGFNKAVVWQSDRFAPQVDLYLVHHFDNQAKRTSLKALEINMRSDVVQEMPVDHATPVSPEQIEKVVIPYNKRDTRETKKFALWSMEALNFRIGLQDTLRGDVLNFNDSKIGSKMLEQRLGKELTHERGSDGRWHMRQTIRSAIPIADIIFPYIRFQDPGFQGALDYLRAQTLRADEFDTSGKVKTKGVFTNLKVPFNGIEWAFGTGGMHGSIYSQHVKSDDEWIILDWDVAALYPSIAIVNGLAPEHLGEAFTREYSKLPIERKKWQDEKGKKCVEANSIKLASNGTYGNSNSAYSVFYDPKFTMTITINGQLMLCMLGEWLATIPGLQTIQCNTDGVTFRLRRSDLPKAERIKKAWQSYTKLVLEEGEYTDMWIRDVGSYVARSPDGSLKQKGAFWFPVNFPSDVAQSQPPAWHKDLGNIISQKAAVDFMVHGIPIAKTINECSDPFLFLMRAKVDRSCQLWIGSEQVQRLTRFYIAQNGAELRKVSPPSGVAGEYKRKNKITDHEFYKVMQEIGPGVWDGRIHTGKAGKPKTQGRYETRHQVYSGTGGFLVAEANDVSHFDWNNLNYSFYVDRAEELVIR